MPRSQCAPISAPRPLSAPGALPAPAPATWLLMASGSAQWPRPHPSERRKNCAHILFLKYVTTVALPIILTGSVVCLFSEPAHNWLCQERRKLYSSFLQKNHFCGWFLPSSPKNQAIQTQHNGLQSCTSYYTRTLRIAIIQKQKL